MSNLKGLELKGGKIVIQNKDKDLRIRKNYSLPENTIIDIENLAKKLNCSASEAIVEAIKVVNALLVEEEPKKEVKKGARKTAKSKKTEEIVDVVIEDDDQPF